MATENKPKKFSIGKVYVKDLSFEAPKPLEVFREGTDWKPDTDVNISWSATQVGATAHEVVLTITVTAKLEETTVYLVEVQQAGVFQLEGFGDKEAELLLSGYCPNTLFPFARQAVADMVAKGGYPQLMLRPVDFDTLYDQQSKQAAKEQEPNEEAAQ